ncbi:Alpha/Beta hydrolase protein [Mycena floridula]|nr:Alpha/Beta hydrolase protein [Mycena floridula]
MFQGREYQFLLSNGDPYGRESAIVRKLALLVSGKEKQEHFVPPHELDGSCVDFATNDCLSLSNLDRGPGFEMRTFLTGPAIQDRVTASLSAYVGALEASPPVFPVSNGFLQHYSRIKRIFSCSYRLSSSFPYPALNPFPAGLLDALAGYNYLVHTLGYQPKNIIISGDSTGGNLAIGLVLYLSKNTFPETLALPVPGALILLLPSVEWSLTHDGPNSSWRRNQASDYGVPFFALGYSHRSLLGKLPADTAITSPWISPGSRKLKPIENLFVGFPPTYILVGEAEIACDSIRTFRDRLCEDIGKDKVRYNEVMDATHDILAMTWFEPERSQALKDITSWLKKTV